MITIKYSDDSIVECENIAEAEYDMNLKLMELLGKDFKFPVLRFGDDDKEEKYLYKIELKLIVHKLELIDGVYRSIKNKNNE
jgi:hypothetical protein